MGRKTSVATAAPDPMEAEDQAAAAENQRAEEWRQVEADRKAAEELQEASSTPSADQGPMEPAPTYPAAYDLAYERRNILQYLLSGIQLQVPFDAAPSAVAERIIQIADEVILKGQARGWIAKDPVPPAEPKAE